MSERLIATSDSSRSRPLTASSWTMTPLGRLKCSGGGRRNLAHPTIVTTMTPLKQFTAAELAKLGHKSNLHLLIHGKGALCGTLIT